MYCFMQRYHDEALGSYLIPLFGMPKFHEEPFVSYLIPPFGISRFHDDELDNIHLVYHVYL